MTDSFAKYEAETVIRLYSEPQRENFVSQETYEKALDIWIQMAEDAGDHQLEELIRSKMSDIQTLEFKVKVVLRKTKGGFVKKQALVKEIQKHSDPETLVVGNSEYAVMEWEIKES